MQVLIVIIEKDGDTYTGHSPNLLGVSVTAKTSGEAQELIIEAIEDRLNELYERHSRQKINVARGRFEETIECVYKYNNQNSYGFKKCRKSAQKDGLCWQHWKHLYSHATGKNGKLGFCELCGESDPKILVLWESECPYKVENKNWEEVLAEKRTIKQAAQTKKGRDERIKKALAKTKKLRLLILLILLSTVHF